MNNADYRQLEEFEFILENTQYLIGFFDQIRRLNTYEKMKFLKDTIQKRKITLRKKIEDSNLLIESTHTFGYKCLMQEYEIEIESCNSKIEFLIRDLKNSLVKNGQKIRF